MVANIQDIQSCPDCASLNIVHSMARDQVICKDCGLIFEPLAPGIEETFEKTHGMPSVKTTAKSKKKTAKKKTKKAKKKAVKKAVKKKVKKKAKKKRR